MKKRTVTKPRKNAVRARAPTRRFDARVDLAGSFAVTDGSETIGMLRPHGRGFEVFRASGDRFDYVAKVGSRSEAMALIRRARDAGALLKAVRSNAPRDA